MVPAIVPVVLIIVSVVPVIVSVVPIIVSVVPVVVSVVPVVVSVVPVVPVVSFRLFRSGVPGFITCSCAYKPIHAFVRHFELGQTRQNFQKSRSL